MSEHTDIQLDLNAIMTIGVGSTSFKFLMKYQNGEYSVMRLHHPWAPSVKDDELRFRVERYFERRDTTPEDGLYVAAVCGSSHTYKDDYGTHLGLVIDSVSVQPIELGDIWKY